MLWLLFFTVFLDMIGFGIVMPMLPSYVASMKGDPQIVGYIVSTFAGCQFIATPLLGRLSDRVGRRAVISVSLLGSALSMGVFAFATFAHMLPLLFLSRGLAGATAGNLSACQASISDVSVNHQERSSAMGLIGAGIGIGMILGPVLGGLVRHLGPEGPPLLAAALATLDLVLVVLLLPETRGALVKDGPASLAQSPPSRLMDDIMSPPFLACLGIMFLTFLTMSNLQVALTLFCKDILSFEDAQIGYVFGFFGFIGVFTQGFAVRRIAARLGETLPLLLGSAFSIVGMLLTSRAHTLPLLLGGLSFFAMGNSVIMPSLSSVTARLAGPAKLGVMLGIAQSAGGLARTIGPSWSGFLYKHVSPGAPFLSGAVSSAMGLLVAFLLHRMLSETSATSSSAPSVG